ncbi:hypothetical protein ACFCX4_17310 [Kitasatospora sp. NPDC056327]|uniref:hypothetical protein n=1 Tax=Kitasatospora sp. NPDC056327 TaxID=3345785 RepID=UPI0035DF5A25
MSDGEWWRKQGPWSESPGAASGPQDTGSAGRGGAGEGESVYAPEPAPAVPPRPPVPPRPAGPPSGPPSAPGDRAPDAPSAFLPRPARSGRDGAAAPEDGSPWLTRPVGEEPADPEALPPAYRAVSTGAWDYVNIDFGDGPVASNRPIPDQRAAPGEETAPTGAGAAQGGAQDGAAASGESAEGPARGGAGGRKGAGAGKAGRRNRSKGGAAKGGAAKGGAAKGGAVPAAGAPAEPAGAASGRRPPALLLLAAAVLIGGAVTGQPIAMLIGWALGYLSRHLSDLTRKIAVFGIPMMTITGSSLWFWGRAQGRWGTGLQPGEQVNQVAWDAAPGVLRVAAVLSAVFLLLMSLSRRGGGGAAGAGR